MVFFAFLFRIMLAIQNLERNINELNDKVTVVQANVNKVIQMNKNFVNNTVTYVLIVILGIGIIQAIIHYLR